MEQRDKKATVRQLRTYGASRAVRHADFHYAGDEIIHVTMCAASGSPFRNERLAACVTSSVEQNSKLRRYRLFGYCLMPDHLHVLLSPSDSDVPIGDWLRAFKGFTGHEHVRLGGTPPLWQRSAYDHICRKSESAAIVLAYIIENPVRAGLTTDWRSWPWSRAFMEV